MGRCLFNKRKNDDGLGILYPIGTNLLFNRSFFFPCNKDLLTMDEIIVFKFANVEGWAKKKRPMQKEHVVGECEMSNGR